MPRLVADAERYSAIVKTEGAKKFLARAKTLPSQAARVVYYEPDKSRYYTEAQALAMPAAERERLKTEKVTEEEYYTTHYGSPLSYARPLDILFARGISLPAGAKYLDFGFGYVGHLRMLGAMGIHATGVDPWPLLPALYSEPSDQGEITGPEGEKGSVRMLFGYFPTDPKITLQVGSGYTLVISKNVLKRGYIHPERPVEHPEKLIKLGVSDEVALKAFYDALVPGGHFLIYNICPALTPPDKPFIPWSDGRSPFTKAQFEQAGFEVLALDQDDAEAVRTMGRALGWDQPDAEGPGMDLVNDLSVLYTLVKKPEKAATPAKPATPKGAAKP